MNIEELKTQNANLRTALEQALQSLEYIESAYPQVAGKAKRLEDILRGRALLGVAEEET